jgi:hypothetical protein
MCTIMCCMACCQEREVVADIVLWQFCVIYIRESVTVMCCMWCIAPAGA